MNENSNDHKFRAMRLSGRESPITDDLGQSVQALRRPNLRDQLYESIFRDITHGIMQPGDRLPSEADYSKRFDVSRPIVREALNRLRADGLIISRQGSGSFVGNAPSPEFLSFIPGGNIADVLRCLEFRIGIEGHTAYLAAERATKADINSMQYAIEQMEEAVHKKNIGVKADFRFHYAVALASQNELFVSTLWNLQELMLAGMGVAWNLSMRGTIRNHLRAVEEHNGIIDSIRNGDRDESRRMMQLHIKRSQKRALTASTTEIEVRTP